MTDYLEELLRGSGEVLEEARRRLEELLSPLRPAAPAQEREGLDAALSRSGRPVSSPELRAGETLSPGLPGEGETPPAAVERTGTEEEPGLPLLGEIQAMEARQARVGAGPSDGTQPRREWTDLSLSGSRARTGSGPLPIPAGLGGRLPEGGTVQSTGQNWAEEVDRAFRRDSRRYDGGFFLY